MFKKGDKVRFKKPYGRGYKDEEFTVKDIKFNEYFLGGGTVTTFEYPTSGFAIGALELSIINLENE